jgi:hypothetical protein
MVEQPQLSPASDTAQSREMARLVEEMTLQRRIKSGASNFYWVAALSVINSLVNLFQGSLYFVVGLAATLFVDGLTSALAKDLGRSPLILGIGFAVSALVAAVFALFGFFAGKNRVWAFAVGMGFYMLDSIIMLVFQEWLGLLFHLLFLAGMWSGFQALRKLRSLQQPATGFYAVPPAESMR